MNAEGLRTFAEIAVNGMQPGSDSPTLTYLVPDPMVPDLAVGRMVWVPLRKNAALGVVVDFHQNEPDFVARPIFEILPATYASSDEQLDFSRWLQRETASSLFACLKLWMPPGVEHTLTPWFELRTRPGDLTKQQAKIVDLLGVNGSMSLDQLQTAIGSSLSSNIPELEKRGAISRRYQSDIQVHRTRTERWWSIREDASPAKLTARQREVFEVIAEAGIHGIRAGEVIDRTGVSQSIPTRLIELNLVSTEDRPILPPDDAQPYGSVPNLTDEQASIWSELEQQIAQPSGRTQVLFGITGSGKTELYLRAIAATLRRGRGAILLVPEIALTGQIAQRVRDRFPGRVAVLHSGMTMGARQEAWAQVESGQRQIVIGPRSALFAPIRNPGLIVIDEEHDGSYKQDSDPRYNARTAAEELARRYGAVVIAGSATPSLETLWAGSNGHADLHRLTRRAVSTAPDLPPIQIVDTRQELAAGHTSLLSRPLIAAMQLALERSEQVMLLLNRRGMATVVLCRSCGHGIVCPNCAIPLVYHQDRSEMICHRCDYRERPQRVCPDCGGPLDYFGAGTQRVETEVHKLFPKARTVRWDMDVNRRAGAATAILKSIENREVDIIVGTQLIAKGLDLPFVTTVGIVNADVGLHFPDFRAGERTFQLITQMAGRAGRRTPNSRVVVQTYSPDHYVLQAASQHDVLAFYKREIQFRKDFRYPPFVRLVRFAVRRATDEDCAMEADSLLRALGHHAHVRGVEIDVVGPAPAFVARIRGEIQWHMILKAKPDDMERLLDGMPHPMGWIVDIDPVSLL